MSQEQEQKVQISKKGLSDLINEKRYKYVDIAKHYGITVADAKRAVKMAGLTMRKFHVSKFEIIEDDAEEQVETEFTAEVKKVEAPEPKKEEVKEVKEVKEAPKAKEEVEHKTVKEGPLDNAPVADSPSTEEAPFETGVLAEAEEILSENVNPATASSTEDEEW